MLTKNAQQDLFQHAFLLVITIMKLPLPHCAHSMHGVYFIHVHNIDNMILGKITMHQYMQVVCSWRCSCIVAYDMGLAPLRFRTCLKHTAHCHGLWSVSRLSRLGPTCPTWTSQCGSQNPHGVHAQKCTLTNWTGFWTKGTKKCINFRDYSPVGSASWMCPWANAYTWLSRRKHKWLTPIPYYSQKGKH